MLSIGDPIDAFKHSIGLPSDQIKITHLKMVGLLHHHLPKLALVISPIT